MPRDAAAARLTELIEALPGATADAIPSRMIADMIALLPTGRTLDVRSSDGGLAMAGCAGSPVLIALSAFAVMMLIVYAISAILSPGLGNGANPPPPHGDHASTDMPRQ